MKQAESVARQVWQEFSPRDGEELACRDGQFWVTVMGSSWKAGSRWFRPARFIPLHIRWRVTWSLA